MELVAKMINRSITILVLFSLAVCLSFVSATTYKSLSMEEVINATEIVFHGKVISIEVELLENNQGVQEPWTKVTFEVIESFKGDLSESHSLYFFGGESESQTIVVDDMPQFLNEESVLVFAYDAQYYSPVVGFSQGLFRLDEEAWQSETGKWLGVAEGSISLGDEATSTSTEVITTLQAIFTGDALQEEGSQENVEDNSGSNSDDNSGEAGQ